MGIKFSEYIRQGKKTFRFIRMSGGIYGCNIEYEYGYFNGDRLDGTRYSHVKDTEFESDPDEKDGIGGMTTVHKRSYWMGSFKGAKKNGFCIELSNSNKECSDSIGFYEMDRPLTIEEFKENSELIQLSDSDTAYFFDNNSLIYSGNTLAYAGQIYDEENPYFCRIYDENEELTSYGFLRGDEPIPFVFDDWETMPVDPVNEDGFSVLREMDFFDGGDLRYTVTEGIFSNGKLNGMGTEYYDSNVNGYHTYKQKSGIFKDGELVFGYTHQYGTRGGGKLPTAFGYEDGRDITDYGTETVYEGKKYIGEAKDGIPCGIGCLFECADKMLKGRFKDGRLHGIGATYKLIDGEWVPYDYISERQDNSYYWNSWGIFAEGEFMPDMTWEEFFDKYENIKKV